MPTPDGVVRAPALEELILVGLPTEATIVHVLVPEYVNHFPSFHLAQIMSGPDDALALADWVERWLGKSAQGG